MRAMTDPLDEALERVGDRWTLAVVRALLDGPRRFSELTAAVEGIAANTLADRLRRLERGGLLVARPYCERPPRHVYELTEEGRALAPAIAALAAWGSRREDVDDADDPPIRV
jgi:DNA-binding HxlR family transcriptional regulator